MKCCYTFLLNEMLLYYLPRKLEIYGYSIVTEPPKYIIKVFKNKENK